MIKISQSDTDSTKNRALQTRSMCHEKYVYCTPAPQKNGEYDVDTKLRYGKVPILVIQRTM